jgi:hypothetical protein
VKVRPSKVVAKGSGFVGNVLVLVDGLPFFPPSKRNATGTKVVQKGPLLAGGTLSQILNTGLPIRVTFVNGDGGTTTVTYSR